MKLKKYSGTVHPEEWIRQVNIYCHIKGIENDKKILKICKLMIDSNIIISNEINSFDELIKALKSHSTFNIYKSLCKNKLQTMKYKPKQDITKFLTNFHSLCNDAEINDPEEIKILLINSYMNVFFNFEFIKRVDGIDSIDEIIKVYSEVVFEDLNTIKYNGTYIALKHVATGKYLTSCNFLNYETGLKQQAVFAGENLPNEDALWFAIFQNDDNDKEYYQFNTVCYNDEITLCHKETHHRLSLNCYSKSPTTGYTEVNCSNTTSIWKINPNSANNNTFYVKPKDKIILESTDNYILRSHDYTFEIYNKTYQEVVGHNEGINENDEWQIELIENYKN
ncbi:hypothetical protein C1645_850553 [Glomus cerebriforme]|uniref:MIR domain-containing protein n=1 Tax=Glomus cerebriforme TaxID=658196 RepID=A0A397TM70_9GLOM|nr:hypothetical protein C1645_850553 [Glomus cerebriforme]